MTLHDVFAGCAQSHQRLLDWLDARPSIDVASASLLPGWTVGHVLSHIARNADGCRNMLDGAALGEIWPMYPGGMDQRSRGIEDGAPRPLAEQVADIRESTRHLEQTWQSLAPDAWHGEALGPFGKIPVDMVPLRRWREVEIHWLDLGLGYTWPQWPDAFVAADLDNRRSAFGQPVPDDIVALGEKAELAWLFSRPVEEGVTPPPAWF